MMNTEHVLATFNEHHKITRVLLVHALSDSDATASYPMLKHREFK